ncbi:MAG: ferrous iron transport protein B, partial [Rudaea sp.]
MDIPFLRSGQAARTNEASCHAPIRQDTQGLPLVAIIGTPNVGKSVLFNALTGIYVTVSNYPGTTVEVSRGKGRVDGTEIGVVDTPGMYRLLPITQEERVARNILLRDRPAVVLHVVDAKNLSRMLPMTLQLIEADLPVVLVVNLMDEAERLGVQVNVEALSQVLGIPVIPTALVSGRGLGRLKDAVADRVALSRSGCGCRAQSRSLEVRYPAFVESAVKRIGASLRGEYRLSQRATALLLLQKDDQVAELVRQEEGRRAIEIEAAVEETQAQSAQPLAFVIARAQQQRAELLLESAVTLPARRYSDLSTALSRAMINPVTGLPLLALALGLLYLFVGYLGAQVLVSFLEQQVFGAWINPWVDRVLAAFIPWQVVRDLFGGEYGIITLGVRYALAIILPIVGTFFIAFSIIEDSGYLPRLALLVDRVMKRLGLNGRAVIPLVLGFGCDTMATIVTRTLETTRERLLATILLSLAIPC